MQMELPSRPTPCFDRHVLERTRKLDRIIGKVRMIIALFIISMELFMGYRSQAAITGYTLLFLYSALWWLWQTRQPSPRIGKWGYFHFCTDLLLMGTFSIIRSTTMGGYQDGLYIILVLMYLIRFGKKIALYFSSVIAGIFLYICFFKHFEHSIMHFILMGTILAIIYFVGNIMDLERMYREKFNFLSNHDQLTGVFNFRHFQEQLAHEIERANRYDHPLALVLFDIDDFKKYNDTFGHEAGNLVLHTAAEIMDGQIRKTDILARFGGEEFVILMPETDQAGAVLVAERIRQTISRHDFPERQVTVSAGVAVYPAEATNAKELFKRADDYLYQSKSGGKNRIRYERL